MKRRLKKHLTLPNLTAVALFAAAASLLLTKLGTLVPGFAAVEQPLPSVHDSLAAAWDKPLYLPFTLMQLFVAGVLPTSGYTSSRLPAVIFGGLLLILMYWVLKQWYGQRLALFGAALVATAPWFLHSARLATSAILYPLGVTALLALAAAWHKKTRPKKLLYVSAIASALLLYVPGMIWLLLALLVVERRNIFQTLREAKAHAFFATLLGLATLAPMIHHLVVRWQDYQSYLGWFGGWDKLTDYPLRFVQVWQHVFLGGYYQPVFNLAGLAMISIMLTVAFAMGVYLYSKHAKASRTKLLLVLWLLATALISLPGPIQNSLLLPIVIVLATGGIGYLLHLWLKVFPRNPLARGFGIGLVALLVVFGVAYNVRNYYVAWPHNEQTVQAFSRRL